MYDAAVITEALDLIKFDDRGLVPAIAQDADSGAVLMMAWMSRESIRETLATGAVTYWSRSRQELWCKGATSGNVQTLSDFRIDCDGDTILLLVTQKGAACHTGERTCFFSAVRPDGISQLTAEQQEPK